MKIEELLMAHYIEPIWKKRLVKTLFTIQRMLRNFGGKYSQYGDPLTLAGMEQVLVLLNIALGFWHEDFRIPFEMEKAQFNSLIQTDTDALVRYPCFFCCRFLHLKIEKFLFENRQNLKNNPEMEIDKDTLFRFLKSLTQTEITSID